MFTVGDITLSYNLFVHFGLQPIMTFVVFIETCRKSL